jgi:hypothetical protein
MYECGRRKIDGVSLCTQSDSGVRRKLTFSTFDPHNKGNHINMSVLQFVLNLLFSNVLFLAQILFIAGILPYNMQ